MTPKPKTARIRDYECPICMILMIEPVLLPCRHELCYKCFMASYTTTNDVCPFCRVRIATWARKALKMNRVINQEKWDLIQRLFPTRVKCIQDGKDFVSDDEEAEAQIISETGSLGKEYMEELQKIEAERLRANEDAEAASLALIKKICETEGQTYSFPSAERLMQIEEEEAASMRLIKQLQEEERQMLLDESQDFNSSGMSTTGPVPPLAKDCSSSSSIASSEPSYALSYQCWSGTSVSSADDTQETQVKANTVIKPVPLGSGSLPKKSTSTTSLMKWLTKEVPSAAVPSSTDQHTSSNSNEQDVVVVVEQPSENSNDNSRLSVNTASATITREEDGHSSLSSVLPEASSATVSEENDNVLPSVIAVDDSFISAALRPRPKSRTAVSQRTSTQRRPRVVQKRKTQTAESSELPGCSNQSSSQDVSSEPVSAKRRKPLTKKEQKMTEILEKELNSTIDNVLSRDDFGTEQEWLSYTEERDRELALRLQKIFDDESKPTKKIPQKDETSESGSYNLRKPSRRTTHDSV